MHGPGGRARYPVAMLAELGAFRPVALTVTVDGTGHQHHAMLVAIGNAPSYGGGMRICPAASLTDGLFTVTVVDEMSVPQLLRLFPRVYRGTHVEHPKANVYTGRRVSRLVRAGPGGRHRSSPTANRSAADRSAHRSSRTPCGCSSPASRSLQA